MQLSVIIPVAPGEQAWRDLLPDLAGLPPGSEIILALTIGAPDCAVSWTNEHVPIRQIRADPGRATQMNAAARTARGSHLWFLHADSRLGHNAIARLQARIRQSPDALLYADLGFHNDAGALMQLNAAGVWWRSHIFGLPFGDQGLCMRKSLFFQLGAYPEAARHGEDHLLVWRAHQQGVKLRPIGARIATSARKYHDQGWCRTTLRHVVLTCRQAAPELYRLLFHKDAP